MGGNLLVVQWLGLSPFTVVAWVQSWPGNEYPTSCIAQPKTKVEGNILRRAAHAPFGALVWKYDV